MNIKCYYLCIAGFLTGLFIPVEVEAQTSNIQPILITADKNTVLRSFIDIENGKRVTHAISVGSPAQVHYTYDADHGKLILLWRGGFLNATPMWHDRGDGSSRPLGKAIQMGEAIPEIQQLSTGMSPLKKDTAGSGFRPKGYTLDKQGLPTFKYLTFGLSVKDATRVLEGARGIHREIELQGSANDLYICLATASKIDEISKDEYAVDGNSYFVKVDDAASSKPVLREIQGRKELLVPVKTKVGYSVLFNK